MSDRICLMNEGEIEQLDTPQRLYFKPETVFAADFLGESNLLDAAVIGREDGSLQLEGPGGARIEASARHEVARGEKVKFMVRPENVRVLAVGEQAQNTLSARLQDIILVGQVTKHYAVLADGTGISATEADAPWPAEL